MAGPGIRYFELAKIFSKYFDTTLLVPGPCDLEEQSLKIISYDPEHSSSSITENLQNFDYIISQALRPKVIKRLKSLKIKFIADLYDPMIIENLEYAKDEHLKNRRNIYHFNYDMLKLQLRHADHILYASDAQRDLYSGMLAQEKMINPAVYHRDPDLDSFLTPLPFGLEQDFPETQKDILEEKFPQIKPDDKIIYWGGGIWNWFDSLSVAKAIEKISKNRHDIKLFFLGTRHPNPKIKAMSQVNELVEYTKTHNLLDKFIFFNDAWTPYLDRANYLKRATIGISTHFDNLETRYSFRTRILDYIWSELPMIVTEGDFMAKAVKEYNLGQTVPYEDPEAIANAITNLIDNPEILQNHRENLSQYRSQFFWDTLALPLIKKIEKNKIPFKPLKHLLYYKLTFNFYLSGFKKKFLR